jgi:hypothetical protein
MARNRREPHLARMCSEWTMLRSVKPASFEASLLTMIGSRFNLTILHITLSG